MSRKSRILIGGDAARFLDGLVKVRNPTCRCCGREMTDDELAARAKDTHWYPWKHVACADRERQGLPMVKPWETNNG